MCYNSNMNNISTKYGILKGASFVERYHSGRIKEFIPTEFNEVKTLHGTFIPQYSDDGERRKNIKPLSFYQNGNIKNISLHKQAPVKTALGIITAEMITFHENGAIKRIFPLDGKLTGFWSEEDEYALAEDIELDFSWGKFRKKVIGVHFYENGSVKSITFWPKDTVSITTPAGNLEGRIGISLYPDGMLKSCEPAKPTPVETPIGIIKAYDSSAIGIHGDSNSLRFAEDGTIKSLVTSANMVEVTGKNGAKTVVQPVFKRITAGYSEFMPLGIEFINNKVRFNGNREQEYSLEENSFNVKPFSLNSDNSCSDCASCAGCG